MDEQISKEPFIPRGKRDGFLLNAIPRDIRERVGEEAQAQDTSLNNIVGEVLAARYELEFSSSGRALKSDFRGGASFFVRLPPAVLAAVREEADEQRIAMRSVMLLALAEHFDLDPPSITRVNPQRRPGRPKHGRPRGRKKVL